MDVYYKKDNPSKTITIVEEQESFYQLSDGQMIKKEVFLKYYELGDNQINESVQTNTTSSDFVDPDDFLNGTKSFLPDTDLQKIKQADPSKGAMEGVERSVVKSTADKTKVAEPINHTDNSIHNESLVKQVNDDNQVIPDNTNTDVSQYKVYDNDEDSYNDFVSKKPQSQQPAQKPVVDIDSKVLEIEQFFEDEKMAYGIEEAQKRKSVRLRKLDQPIPTTVPLNAISGNGSIDVNTPQAHQPTFDPAEMMFKSFKRNHDISINIEIKDKIGNPDFIKMMMENMDGDIVGFYKNLVMDKVMGDIHIIEDAIEISIKKAIFGDDYIEEVETEVVVDFNEKDLIKGEKTKTGKQKYKFINNTGKVVDMAISTAKKKGYNPHKKQ